MKLKNILLRIFRTPDTESHSPAGFSTTPRSTSTEYSWQKAQPASPPVPVVTSSNAPKSYPPTNINKSGETPVFWKPAEGGVPGGRKPPTGGNDLDKYGFPLPRYALVETARYTYIAGNNFEPAQTLLRYDPESLNILAEREFRSDPKNVNKPFTKPHDERFAPYDGFFLRQGVEAARLHNTHGGQDRKSNKKGGYLIDIRELAQSEVAELKKRISQRDAVALREHYAIPGMVPNRSHYVEISGWKVSPKDSPEKDRLMRVSRTIGGGEQIIGDPGFFKFFVK